MLYLPHRLRQRCRYLPSFRCSYIPKIEINKAKRNSGHKASKKLTKILRIKYAWQRMRWKTNKMRMRSGRAPGWSEKMWKNRKRERKKLVHFILAVVDHWVRTECQMRYYHHCYKHRLLKNTTHIHRIRLINDIRMEACIHIFAAIFSDIGIHQFCAHKLLFFAGQKYCFSSFCITKSSYICFIHFSWMLALSALLF